MMYNGGAKLKVKVVRQAVSHLTFKCADNPQDVF